MHRLFLHWCRTQSTHKSSRLARDLHHAISTQTRHDQHLIVPLQTSTWGLIMLRYAVIFLVVALIAAMLGFTTIVGPAMEGAKILFFVFLVLFVVSLIMGRRTRDIA